jgi:hypothetical protein
MKAITHIENALKEVDEEVQAIVMNPKLSLNEKDDLMLPLVRQKRVLQQTLEDLTYLKENPPSQKGGCGMSRYRDDA